MKKLVWLALALTCGCEVSVFGSEPMTVIPGSGIGVGGERAGDRCDEPDDARQAREGAADDCAAHCRIDVAAGTSDCGSEVALGAVRAGVATLDLSSADGVVLTLELCDPTGAPFQLSDSPTARATGGDTGTSSHDADMLLDGTTLTLRAATTGQLEPSTIGGWVAAAGCTTRHVVVADQIAYLVEPGAGLCGRAMFRIDPPTDEEGTPDARWFLALDGSLDQERTGTGLRSVELCFY